jgi:hypothetical protein
MLLPFSGAFVIALLGTEIPSDRVYNAFLFTALLTGLAGLICLILALRSYQSNTALVAQIKGRMPPAGTPAAPASGS